MMAATWAVVEEESAHFVSLERDILFLVKKEKNKYRRFEGKKKHY